MTPRLQAHRGQRAGQGGFTLVEVMIALLILGIGLGVLLRSASGNLAAARRAEMYAVATELGRSKMYDIEETLIQEGFQQLDQELDGDFDDEGWEDITWEAKIVKIELPSLESLNAINGEDGEGGEGGGGSSMLSGMLGFLPSGLGSSGGGLDPSASAGAAVIGSQFELISNVLEESIRKVTLTIKWKNGRFKGEIVLDCYFTEPAAISRLLGGVAAAAGAGSSGSGTSGSGTATTPTRGGSGGSGSSRGSTIPRGGR